MLHIVRDFACVPDDHAKQAAGGDRVHNFLCHGRRLPKHEFDVQLEFEFIYLVHLSSESSLSSASASSASSTSASSSDTSASSVSVSSTTHITSPTSTASGPTSSPSSSVTTPTSTSETSASSTSLILLTKLLTPTSSASPITSQTTSLPTTSPPTTGPTATPTTTPTTSPTTATTTPTTASTSATTTQSSHSSESLTTRTTISTSDALQAVSSTSGGGAVVTSSPDPSEPAEVDTRTVWALSPPSTALAGNHAPVVASRFFLLGLSALYSQLQVYEPVRQLASGGISGPDLVSSPFGAVHLGALAAHVGSALSAGAAFVDTSYCGIPATPANLNPCAPRVAVNPWVLDVLLVVLAIQVIIIVHAAAKWFKKPSGLSADPTTIAGVAVVMGHPAIERQFAGFPGDITEAQLKERLKDHEFKLGTYTTEAGLLRYGIMPADEEDAEGRRRKVRDPNGPLACLASVGACFTSVKDSMSFLRGRQNNRFYFDLVFLAFLLALLGLTIASIASIDHPQTVFLSAPASSGVGMKIFFALLGVAVSLYWGRLFRDAQTFTPYFPLRAGEARPNPTILLSRHSNPVTAFLPLLRNRHLAAASVAFTGLLAEVLIIALAGLPYRPGQMRSEFLFCGIAAVVILLAMIVQLVVVNFWRRAMPHLPRRPDTIANVMTYVAETGIVRDFHGLEDLSVSRRNQAIRDMRKTYAYGWRKEDESGRIRWVIDEMVPAEGKSLLDRHSGDRTSGEPVHRV
ncbi:hypothetical protein GQ53DRAFT_805291 [Thozetella sp. PMI_491]|nr:hypothetical protein GQ53DRAFT_805291 [Thozetella sp. PMI_491]